MSKTSERPTKKAMETTIAVLSTAHDEKWFGDAGESKHFNNARHLIRAQMHGYYPDTPKPKWPPETVEKVRVWMREFDLVIMDGVPEGWGEVNVLKASFCSFVMCGQCHDCFLIAKCATKTRSRMDESLEKRGAHTIACVRMRCDELRKHLDSVGLDWRTPEGPKAKEVTVDIEMPKPERKFIAHISKYLADVGKYEVQIIGQSHRGKDFGSIGYSLYSKFTASNGIILGSAEISGITGSGAEPDFWVRGGDVNGDLYWSRCTPSFHLLLIQAFNEYNEHFSGEGEGDE